MTGALPLTSFEQKIDRWSAERQASRYRAEAKRSKRASNGPDVRSDGPGFQGVNVV